MAILSHSSLLHIRFRRSWDVAVQPEHFDLTISDNSNLISSLDNGSLSPFIILWLVIGTVSICLLSLIVTGFVILWRHFGMHRHLSSCGCLWQVCRIILMIIRKERLDTVVAETTDTNDRAFMTNSPEHTHSSVATDRLNYSESIV